MVLSDLTTNLTEWFVLKDKVKEEHKEEIKEEPKEEPKEEIKEEIKEEPKEEIKEEPKEEIKEESIYIILINNRPYGYYYSEDETEEQVEQAKEYIMSQHLFDFKKNYYWSNLPVEEYTDTILKMKLVSNIKDVFVRYDYVEDSLEIVKSILLPLRKE